MKPLSGLMFIPTMLLALCSSIPVTRLPYSAKADTRAYYYVANTSPPDDFLALRTAPSSLQGPRVEAMPNGTLLEVIEKRPDGWWFVRDVGTGKEGWALSGNRATAWIVCCTPDRGAGASGQVQTANAQSPSFDCSKARYPDEVAICRNPELAELDDVAAAAYAYLKSTRGRAFADEIGIPFWRLRQACQYDIACIRQRQIEALNSYQAAGAPVPMLRQSAQRTFGWNAEAAVPSSDPSSELHECRNSKDAADRIAHCSNVIAVSRGVPALVTAYNTRGLALVELGQFREAIDDFSFVIAREPNVAGYYDNRENAYRRSRMFNEALSDANKAIQLAPTYSFVFRSRANVYNDMGEYDLAVEDYSRAIRISPEDGGLFIDRGKTLRSQSKFDEAISDFSHALDLDTKWTAAYRERGLTYKQLGRTDDAISDLTKYAVLQPGDPDITLALSELEGPRPSPRIESPAIQPTTPLPTAPAPGVPSSPPPAASSGPTLVPLVEDGGTFAVPVTINGQLTLKFVVDSGASDVSIPADVVMVLLRTETITEADFLGKQTYRLADGSTLPSQQFTIRSLKIGDRVLENVIGSIAPVSGSLLLGQSFLSRFRSWSIDNERHALVLN